MQKVNKQSAKELKRKHKQEKLLIKAKKKYGITENVEIIRSNKTKDNIEKIDKKDNELIEKLSKLTKEEQEILLKLLGRW